MMYLMNLSTLLYDQSFVVLIVGLIVADTTRRRLEVVLIGLAFKFVRQLLQALVVPLTGVQTPLFSRLYAENRMEGLRTAYSSLTRFLILVLLPAGAGLVIMAQPILVLIYVQSGADAVLAPARLPEAVAACAILTVGLFGESMVSVALNVLMVHEDYPAVLVARAFALVSVPLIVLLEPPLGAVGLAIAVATAALGSRLIALAFGLRRLGLQFPAAFLGKVALATLTFVVVIGPLSLLLPTDPVPPLTLPWFVRAFADGTLVLGAVLLFWLVFRRLGGLQPEDRQRFAGMRIPGIKRMLRYL
jgi:peptidoglycan biosynthesis protein MviN/MurJ (putative lipid II flippase)